MVTTSGPGHDSDLPAGDSILLVHPGLAGFGRADHRHAGRRRLLSLGARRLRRLLGISRRLVELVRVIPAGQRLRGAVRRLPGLLFSRTHGMEALHRFSRHRRGHHLHQRARHSDGGKIRHRARAFHSAAGAGAGGHRTGQVASQSVCSGGPSASADVPRVRRGTGAWAVAVFRIRAVLDGRGRSGQSAPQLSAGPGAGRAHVDRGLLPAHAGFARGVGQLGRAGTPDSFPPRRNSSEAAGSAPGCRWPP